MAAPNTYVLVHGAWHGGWCWARVAPILESAGHRVHAPTLTGLGDSAALLRRDIALGTHVDDILRLLRERDLREVVLCGHSYAGMVITGAADAEPSRLRALVYVDAVVPQDGDCALDPLPPERRALIEERTARDGDGWKVPPTPAARFGVTDPRDAAWIDALCTPHPYRTLAEPIRLSGAHRRVPTKVYVLASAHSPSAYWQYHERAAADRGWRAAEVPSGHEMMVTHPRELAEILLTV